MWYYRNIHWNINIMHTNKTRGNSTNLIQLIDELTNIRSTGMSCIDLIITDQPNLFIDFGVHPSLDNHCHYQIIHGKINLSLTSPTLQTANLVLRESQKRPDRINYWNCWLVNYFFLGLDVDDMTELFTSTCSNIFSLCIPNKIITCDDHDPPWMTATLKSAIKRQHRVYNKYVKRRRKADDWEYVRSVRNETSAKINKAKDNYFSDLGKKLSDPTNGIKSYWATLNNIINKKKFSSVPPLLENGVFDTRGALPYWVILGMCGQNRWVFQAENLRMGVNFWPKPADGS